MIYELGAIELQRTLVFLTCMMHNGWINIQGHRSTIKATKGACDAHLHQCNQGGQHAYSASPCQLFRSTPYHKNIGLSQFG